MKKLIILMFGLLICLCIVGCNKEKRCYVCCENYQGKSYDYPTFGGTPEEICKRCYEKLFFFDCEMCHKSIKGDRYILWPPVSFDTNQIKVCKNCFDNKLVDQ